MFFADSFALAAFFAPGCAHDQEVAPRTPHEKTQPSLALDKNHPGSSRDLGEQHASAVLRQRFRFAVALALTLLLPATAHAEEPTAGRLDGDLTLAGGLGATFGPRAPRTTVDLRARYMSTSGLFLTYEDKAFFKDAEPERVLAFGLELRPLFLARWLTGKELDSNRADMLIDSFGLELGGFAQQPQGRQFGAKPGFQAGLGLEIPLFSRATGLFIATHAGCRWADSALSGETVQGPTDRALFLGVTLSWHQVIASHLIDAGDRGPE